MTTFPDAQLITLQVLRAVAGSLATYGTLAPEEFPSGEIPPLPYVMVRTDSTVVHYPVAATSAMRLVCYAANQADSVALAWRVNGALRDYVGNPSVRRFVDQLGPVPATDPDTGNPLCAFTVSALLRPTP